jgi:membrane dipeptidase
MKRLALASLLCVSCAGAPSPPATRVHGGAIVVDTHEDVPDALFDRWADVGTRGATPHFDIPRAREGGLGAVFFAIYVPAELAEAGGSAKRALELIDLTHQAVAAHPADLALAGAEEEIRAVHKRGRIAVLMGIEGGHAIEDSLGALRQFYRMGVRYMTLTHTNSNGWADSSGNGFAIDFNPEAMRRHHGLSPLGRDVVREMNRLGMMVDVSHVSDETIEATLAVSRAPIFASHSSCRALSAAPRNLTDDQIQKIAARGGVVMINFSSAFLDGSIWREQRAALDALRPEAERIRAEYASDPRERARRLEQLTERIPKRVASSTRAIEHIEHVIRLAGPNAVGLGTDYDGIGAGPRGLEDVSKLPWITEELLRRGHSEETVRKVLGENFLRYFARVEAVARSLAAEPPARPTALVR